MIVRMLLCYNSAPLAHFSAWPNRSLGGTDRQGVVKDVARAPLGFDLLEPRVVDEGTVDDLARHRHASGVSEEIPVELANPD